MSRKGENRADVWWVRCPTCKRLMTARAGIGQKLMLRVSRHQRLSGRACAGSSALVPREAGS